MICERKIEPLHAMVKSHGGYRLLAVSGVEADDVIGTLGARSGEGGPSGINQHRR